MKYAVLFAVTDPVAQNNGWTCLGVLVLAAIVGFTLLRIAARARSARVWP